MLVQYEFSEDAECLETIQNLSTIFSNIHSKVVQEPTTGWWKCVNELELEIELESTLV